MNKAQRQIKKAAFTLTAILFIFYGAFIRTDACRAQWTTSGNNTTTTNNVGVGTSNPSSTLEVQAPDGPLTLSQSGVPGKSVIQAAIGTDLHLTANGKFSYPSWNRFDTALPSWNIFLSPTADYMGIRRSSAASGVINWSDFFVIKNTGNIGIGTSAPDTRLTVVGPSTSIPTTYNNGEVATFIAPNDSFNAVSIAKGGVTNPQGLTIGVNQASLYSEIQSAQMGVTTNNLILNRQGGNVGIGTANPTKRLTVNGDIEVSGNINAKYQDVAEWVQSRQKLSAGTVVILDPEKSNQVIASTEAYDTRVAGVISEQPGVLLGEGGEGKVKVATTGRVKVKVDASKGAIKIGDLLVTSDKEGVAMKSEPIMMQGRRMHAPGTIIGKALEALSGGVGEIQVLLSLQ
jgi:hypothetical protein